jgi:hypothetical protein
MGFMHKIFQKDHRAEVMAEGPINLSQCMQAMVDLGEDLGFNPTFHVLVDLRNMEYMPSTSDVQALVSKLAELKSYFQGRIGIVVSGSFLFGMARMTCLLAETAGFNMIPFKDYDSALQWVQYGYFLKGSNLRLT